MPLRRTPLRKLKISKDARTPSEKQRDAQERYYTKLVTENPKYGVLISTLKEGVSATEIASHFARNNWITVNERTFAEAVRSYKRSHQPEIDSFDTGRLDKWVEANVPTQDPEAILQQVARLQQMRIAIDVHHEKEMGKLFDTTHKEIKVLTDITELMLRAKGRVSGPAGARRDSAPVSGDVTDNLNLIRKDQTTSDRLHGLTRKLVENTQ